MALAARRQILGGGAPINKSRRRRCPQILGGGAAGARLYIYSAPSDFILSYSHRETKFTHSIVIQFVADYTDSMCSLGCCWYLNLKSELQPAWFASFVTEEILLYLKSKRSLVH